MRIKRIEIIGFKSFCDRTVITFHDPITAVVGPNGCGKSNVVDAIRWCMGEQSAKHLRGQSMADVIFNGSDKRGPAGMAQVSLTFENVGFSHEALELLSEDSAEQMVDAAMSAAEAATDDDAASEDVAGGEIEAPEELSDAVPEEVPVEKTMEVGPAQDAEPPAKSATQEVEEFLVDAPPAIDYSQYSEVTITRRLFRDGTSGYFLNQTPCRLRDITDFFLGTGVGTKAYSIIEQGRIGMIVSSRPQERRHLIEEAAGVTKFKTKKRAAERKLEQTRQNLLRVTDIVDELAKRMGSLKRQAQKAERYRRYRAEVRDIELWKASHRFLELSVDEQRFHGRLTEVNTELGDARGQFEARDGAIVAERAELSVEERRLAALQEQIYELENQVKLSENKIEYQRREAQELDQRVEKARTEISGLEERRRESETDLAGYREELGESAGRTDSATQRAEQRKSAFEEARTQLRDAQSALDAARQDVAAARTELATMESRAEASTRRREDVERRLARVQEEKSGVDQSAAEFEKKVTSLDKDVGDLRQTRMSLGQKADELSAKKGELATRRREVEAEVETARTELNRKKSRLQSLREIQERYEGFARGTRSVMQNRGQVEGDAGGIHGLVADVISAPENLEIAVEAALGERLGGVLVAEPDVGKRAVQYLKDAAAGRSTFVPTQGVDVADERHAELSGADGCVGAMVDLIQFEDQYANVGRALLGGVYVAESLEHALSLKGVARGATFVTLAGDVVDDKGAITGGEKVSEGSSILAQKREIRELEETTRELEETVADAGNRLAATKSELAQTVEELESVKGEAHERELALTGKEKELSNAQQQRDGLRDRMTRLSTEKSELEESLETLAKESEERDTAMRETRERIADRESAQLGLASEVTEGQVKAEELSVELTEAKVEVAQLGEKRASLEAAVLRGENNVRELGERIETLSASIATDEARATELRREASELSESLVGQREKRTAEATALAEGRSTYETRLAELEVKDHEARQLRQRADALSQEVSGLEVKLETVSVNREHLEAGIKERYGVALRREICDYHMRPAVGPEEEERLTERRRLIDRMGSDINLTAIEEFREVSERHDFLASQREDLDNAVTQLEKAINKINRTSRKLFRDTFEAINENFSSLFPRLFRGGQARLALTGGDDVDLLDAGVEIFAQPPGKKNSTVDQLSGGEKALTAVALLFSIFLNKPSPFCLLDEVDAPLDDANVDRYNEIIREMIDRSQFIVITHNKRTMEIADRLYGVTMQEPGVSKLVSVNLNRGGDAEEAA